MLRCRRFGKETKKQRHLLKRSLLRNNRLLLSQWPFVGCSRCFKSLGVRSISGPSLSLGTRDQYIRRYFLIKSNSVKVYKKSSSKSVNVLIQLISELLRHVNASSSSLRR